MANKRRSEKGIVLKTGESQLSDGRYRYRYYDDSGRAHDVYAWRLRPEDETPEGKKAGKSLREKEKDIEKGIKDGLKAWDNITVEKLVKEYIEAQKPYWEPTTQYTYTNSFNWYIKDGIGKKKVSKVEPADIEKFYLSLHKDKGLSVGTLEGVNRLLNPAFRNAVTKKKIISTNPCTGILKEVKQKIGNEREPRHALEQSDLATLLKYIKENHARKYPLIYVMGWTGMRIGEVTGLAWCDIDFTNEVIRVRRTLEYCKINGHFDYILKKPKTAAGTREIPMLKEVKSVLLELKRNQKIVRLVPEDQVTINDTIFRTTWDKPVTQKNVNGFLHYTIAEYNSTHKDKLPDVTPHIFRHTFTCWMIENFSEDGKSLVDNLKYIQSVLGHADAGVTLNIYSELREEKKKEKHEIIKKIAAEQ